MLFDEEKNVIIDPESGEIIPVLEGDQIPQNIFHVPKKRLPDLCTSDDNNIIDIDDIVIKGTSSNKSNPTDFDEKSSSDVNTSNSSQAFPAFISKTKDNEELTLIRKLRHQETESTNQTPVSHEQFGILLDKEYSNLELNSFELANFLQTKLNLDMKFDYEDHSNKLHLHWYHRPIVYSAFLSLFHVSFLIYILSIDHAVSIKQNIFVGPSVGTLIKYGAKDAWLMVKDNEWWRLISAVTLHAGIVHLIINVLIQSYLAWIIDAEGRSWAVTWIAVYIMSGIYATLLSVSILKDTIGVSSTGATVGLLTAWLVWTGLRWHRVLPYMHNKRYLQASFVGVSLAISYILAISSAVDWASSVGGMLMGGASGALFYAYEVRNVYLKRILQLIAAAAIILMFGCTGFQIGLYLELKQNAHSDRFQY